LEWDEKNLRAEAKAYKWGCLLGYPDEFKDWLGNNQPKTLLDIGCHNMLLRDIVHEVDKTIKYVGLDVISYEKKPDILAPAWNIPVEDKSFDVVTVIETLEHCLYLTNTLTEIKRVCKKSVFIQSPWYSNLSSVVDKTHYHVLNPTVLMRLMEMLGFKNMKTGKDTLAKPSFYIIADV